MNVFQTGMFTLRYNSLRNSRNFRLFLRNNHFQRGDRLYTSESDLCRRHIMTYKDDAHAERNKIFIMVI